MGGSALGRVTASYGDPRACWKPVGEGVVYVVWRQAGRVMESSPFTLHSQNV